MVVLLLAPAMLALDPGALIKGLIYLLLAAILVCVFCYVIARLAAQFMPGAAAYAWLIWAIGGLILLLIAFQIFAPLIT